MISLQFNSNGLPLTDYNVRHTVKAVVVNEEGKVILFPNNLIGGGVEEGETDEEALHREAMEEAGFLIEVIKPLGEIIAFRDSLKQQYAVRGYLCKYICTVSTPTTTDESEKGLQILIEHSADSITRIKQDMENIKQNGPSAFTGDSYQAALYNRQTTLAFIQEAFKEEVSI